MGYGLVLHDRRGFVRRFIEKPDWRKVITDRVNTGVYVVSARAMSYVPPKQPFDFARDLFPCLLDAGEKVVALPMSGYWCDAGTPPSVADTVTMARAVLEDLQPELAGMTRIAGVGAAVPGLVNSHDGSVLLAPHLMWSGEPLAAELSAGLGLPARAANDANLGSLAESLFGAAVGESDVVYLNGSASGIGGGAMVGGMPLRGAAGYAGELGHTVVPPDGLPCHCGRRGCLETEVSLGRLLAVLKLDHADQDQLEAAMVRDNSPELIAETHRQLDLLAIALTNFVNIFNPGTIVLGGFLGVLHSFAAGRLEAAVADGGIGGLGSEVPISRAALGADLLLVGAAELAFAPVLAAPHPA